ncbi:long-chain acyl-CoA synthetase [Actinokineospora alba]|uniref:Long-chain acyl-CoA synthetase n=1 Tax=Actinokineospora alba TaxID=504798 RepID=A0A1H0P8J8_9PSEU|nr:AMP-binding protein [Actinokineospora alba]TDP65688.1 long-chain acyl-CoA synthetase [Actinokineospora alba]SDI67503.1 long-chain acyl-CoA synthetase [Actinokineospora alba]SDP01437.1 long-chain acyl-CoA synthetase [Actinokineospora alba]
MARTPTGTVADLMARTCEKVPRHLALVDISGARSLTWQQVGELVERFASALVGAGLAAGDRVALRLPNTAESVVALFGVLRAGGAVVPIGTDAAPREIERVLAHSGAAFTAGDLSSPDVTAVALPDLDATDPFEPAPKTTRSGEDLAVLAYTSGTGGTPRGVMLSHRALLTNVEQCAALHPAPVISGDRVLLTVPLSHAYGLSGLWQVAAAGATAVLLDKFGVETALTACQEHRVTTVIGVPAIYQAFVAAGHERLGEALSTVRVCTSGAAPLDAATLALFRQETGLAVFEGYGLTETGPVLTSTLVGGVAKPGSVGRAIPGVELRLVDSEGNPVVALTDPDEFTADLTDEATDTGLVSARGANLFSGYWPDGEGGPDAEGWFRTGDVGYFDEDGDLHLIDRANDLIIVNGFNVYPHEVEQVVAELDVVAEAAAVGEPDERTGEHVKIVVVLVPGAELSEDALRAHCAERLAKFKIPATVEFAKSLPHSVMGKLRRAGLRGSVTP